MAQGDPSAGEWAVLFGLVAALLWIYLAYVIPAMISTRRDRRRTRRLQEWAGRNGWRLEDEDARLTQLARNLASGAGDGRHSRLLRDVLHGADAGTPVYSFTYRWES